MGHSNRLDERYEHCDICGNRHRRGIIEKPARCQRLVLREGWHTHCAICGKPTKQGYRSCSPECQSLNRIKRKREEQRSSGYAEFWSFVDKNAPNGCWVWTGKTKNFGYGLTLGAIAFSSRAHRASWEMAHGAIPDGLQVLHRCDNPPCVNPAHLFLGTQVENIQDMAAKGRRRYGTLRGEAHTRSVLTESLVHEIRRLKVAKVKYAVIAKTLGVGYHAVYDVIRGRTWKHLAVEPQ